MAAANGSLFGRALLLAALGVCCWRPDCCGAASAARPHQPGRTRKEADVMALRMSHGARQTAWLAGNVLGEIGWEAGRVGAATATLLPYPCEISPPFVPFSTAGFLRGPARNALPVPRAGPRSLAHLRLWFRTGQEVDWRQFGGVVRQIAVSGRLAFTKCISGRKIAFWLTVERGLRESVGTALRGFLPGLELVEQPNPLGRMGGLLQKGWNLEIRQFYSSMPYWRAFPGPKDLSAPSVRNELGALAQVHRGIGFIQTVFERAPEGHASNCTAAQAGEDRALRVGHVGPWGYDGLESNKKIVPNTPLYAAVLRCGVVCASPAAAKEAIEVVSRPYRSVFHGSRPLDALDTAQHLAVLGSAAGVVRMLDQGDVHTAGILMTEDELSANFVHTPPAELLESGNICLDRTVAPPVPLRLRSGGTQIGWQPYADKLLPVVIPDHLRSCMVSYEGTTGSGKSEGLINLVIGDLERGVVRGGLVVDFHGLLCPQILRLLPREWIEKTIYIKPNISGYVFRYNPYADRHGDIAARADRAVDATRMLFKESEWGSNVEEDSRRYNHILFAGEGLCLADAPLFTSRSAAGQRLLQSVLPNIKNEEILRFWEEYRESNSANMRKALSKVVPFLSSPAGRIFSQPDNVLDFAKCMREGKLILADLAIGPMGAMAADAIASFLLAQAFAVRMEQLAAEGKLVPWGDWADEAHRVTASVLRSLATQQRKTNALMTVAFQSRDLFGEKAKTALRNIGTSVFLNLHPEDAAQATRLSAGLIEARHLIGRPVGTGWAYIDSLFVPLRLLPPRKPKAKNHADDIIEYSLAHYYLTEKEFEQKLQGRKERLGHGVRAKKRREYDEI